jgi:hypothetical protein
MPKSPRRRLGEKTFTRIRKNLKHLVDLGGVRVCCGRPKKLSNNLLCILEIPVQYMPLSPVCQSKLSHLYHRDEIAPAAAASGR